jgi:dihydroorotase
MMFTSYDPANDPDQLRLRQTGTFRYDLLLKGGTVLDPANGIHRSSDIAFVGDRVAALGDEISSELALQTLNIAGDIVTPGWVDFHVHAFPGVSPLSVPADEYSLPRGVTTAVSAGDAGASTFEGFIQYVIKPARTRLFGFLNICRTGLAGYPAGELRDLLLLDVAEAARAAREHEAYCLGIKVRMTRFIVGDNGMEPLHRAIAAAELAHVPVMVHVYDIPGTLDELLACLRPGDIVTHVFMGTQNGILDGTARLLPVVLEARSRGVLFDVGHGSKAGFSIPVARAALEQGFLPDTISTDAHTQSVNTTMTDLATVMSKFLNLGMTIEDVVERVTARPAALIGKKPMLGTLSINAPADAVVMRLVENDHGALFDDAGNQMSAQHRIVVQHTISRGRLVGAPYRYPHV